MKSVGKTVKIARQNGIDSNTALAQLLSNYRDSPHPATGLTPNDMMFRHPPQSTFPRKQTPVNEEQITRARERDRKMKLDRQ